MRKFINFLFSLGLLITIIFAQPKFKLIANANSSLATNYGYYKVLSSCLFFKTSDITDMSYENVYYIIPEGYFVKKISDISATTIKVSYGNKTGYVMSERVKLVSFLPNQKYLDNITFDILSSSGTQLWSKPSSEEQANIIVKLVPSGTKSITYIASARGEIPAGATSSIWYYCYYSPANDPTSVYEGYIHSEKTTNLTDIPKNLEDDEIITNDYTGDQDANTLSLPSTLQIILISLISLPLLVIIILLITSSKRKEKLRLLEELNLNNDDYSASALKDPPIQRTSSKQVKELKNKKFSIKSSFDKFMYEQPKPTDKTKFIFENLDIDDDEDLL